MVWPVRIAANRRSPFFPLDINDYARLGCPLNVAEAQSASCE
jgi:hypothetical protein